MRNKDILKLMAGFRRFKNRYFDADTELFSKLTTQGQSPKTLIIGCSDSRVDPALISSASPGEIFVVRNVANLVPPYERDNRLHGVSSAIEFAVLNLKVENIIVLGHRQCGGIRALVEGLPKEQEGGFISHWVRIAESAKVKVLNAFPNATMEEKVKYCEQESIVVSLRNLKSFPFISEAVAQDKLTLVGAYFDLEQGKLLIYEEENDSFQALDI